MRSKPKSSIIIKMHCGCVALLEHHKHYYQEYYLLNILEMSKNCKSNIQRKRYVYSPEEVVQSLIDYEVLTLETLKYLRKNK